MPFAFDTLKQVTISFATKLLAINKTTHPARIISKYMITALIVVGMLVAIRRT
jgi:hypothetical protein